MEWFVERHDGTAFMVKVDKKLYEGGTFQKIEIYSTPLGKMLVLDGKIQFTEKDEMMYHEMLVHVPMMMHASPKKILIIGGGDGGGAREALKHEPGEIVVVEIDREVVEKCREYIGIDGNALNDERVGILYEDGIEFVKNCREHFDVVIVDGTDPNIFSSHIASRQFYEAASKISDIMVTQSQSPFFQPDYFKAIVKNSAFLKNRRFYISYMPSYPSGLWSFMISGNYELNEGQIKRRWKERGIKTKHYNPDMHIAAFALPEWMREMINGSSKRAL